MLRSTKVRFGLAAFAAVSSLALAPVMAQAQGGFGGGMPPDMMAKIKALQKWREQHKNVSNLQTMLYQVREIDKTPDTALDKKQARQMLGVINKWKSLPELNEDQAHTVQVQIGNILNLKQIQKMTTIQMPFGRPGGGRPGGGPPPGGPGGFKIPDPPKGSYNPLNVDTLPFVQMRPMAKRGMDEFMATLQRQAKG